MRVLLDSCIWGPTQDSLRAAGHDVVWVGDWPEDPGDEVILRTAFREQRVLVTLDKDFGELAVGLGFSHPGIIRIVGGTARRHAAVCLQVLSRHGDDLAAGAIVTAEPGRLRVRLPDKGQQEGDRQ